MTGAGKAFTGVHGTRLPCKWHFDLSLGDLVEGIVLHAFEGKAPFGPPVIDKIEQLQAVCGLTLTAGPGVPLVYPAGRRRLRSPRRDS
jgi:hypothetical protein